jgi:hypothetical protein
LASLREALVCDGQSAERRSPWGMVRHSFVLAVFTFEVSELVLFSDIWRAASRPAILLRTLRTGTISNIQYSIYNIEYTI